MDAFYASIEQRDDATLRGRPVAVGGDPRGRGVVCAASYEARAFGVRSAMPMARAVRLCPALVVVAPDFARYRAESSRVFGLFRAVTPLVEALSLDEAYLDVTDNAWREPLGVTVARRLKQAIREATGLTASAGVAPNKFLAKIASGWRKPDGLTVIAPERVEAFLQRLPVDALWGVGPVTERKLRALGISRLVDVRLADPDALRQAVGRHGEWLRQLAVGHDPRPVEPNRPRKSAGAERTFASDLTDVGAMQGQVDALARQVAAWMMRRGVAARTVTLKVRYADFATVTRSDTREAPESDAASVAARAVALLGRTEVAAKPVRLLGVTVHNLAEGPGAPGRDAARAGGSRLPFAADEAP